MSADLAIVGAGPAGAALATLCARGGMSVTLFEQHEKPKVVVGESLLPFGNRVLEMLGVSMEGFLLKYGALFHHEGRPERFAFSEAERPIWPFAHQVERAVFDERIREVARAAGVHFEFGAVRAAPQGYRWTVDASGRCRTIGRAWTTHHRHENLKNAAVAGHFENVLASEGSVAGDIAILSLPGAWFWVIPLTPSVTSVGLVTTPARRGLRFEAALDECPEAKRVLAPARALTPLRGHQDFTEVAERFVGDDWALVGDAAMFLDPVFSSGVLFGLEGAERLSRVLLGTLSGEQYQSEMRAAGKLVEALILGFYSGDFFDLAFTAHDAQSLPIRQGVVSLLAGDVFEDGGARLAQVVARRLPELAARMRESRTV
jgi:flavin-dependent dehydrogenase